MQPCISLVRWSAVPRSPLSRARNWRRRWGPTVTWRSPPSAMTGWRISSQRWWTPPKPTGSSGVPRRRNVRHVSSSEADSWLLTNPVLFYVMPIDQVILNYVDKLDILPCLAHVHENMLHCICNMAKDTLMLYVVATWHRPEIQQYWPVSECNESTLLYCCQLNPDWFMDGYESYIYDTTKKLCLFIVIWIMSMYMLGKWMNMLINCHVYCVSWIYML